MSMMIKLLLTFCRQTQKDGPLAGRLAQTVGNIMFLTSLN